MSLCDRCGAEARRLFEHRVRTETMTHRRTSRLCAGCHPSVTDTSDRGPSADRLMTDGGTRAVSCPTCSGAMIDDGTSVSCVDCGWTTTR